MDTQSPLASKTLWGAVMTIAAIIMSLGFGVDLSLGEQAEMTDKIVVAIQAVTAVFGPLFVIWGRLTAKKKITLTGR